MKILLGVVHLCLHPQFRWFLEIRGYRRFSPFRKIFLYAYSFFSSFLLFYLLETQENFIEDNPEDKVCPQHSRDLRSNCLLPIWLFQLPVVPIHASYALFLLLPSRYLGITPSCLKVMTCECIFRYTSMLLNPQLPHITEISMLTEICWCPHTLHNLVYRVN